MFRLFVCVLCMFLFVGRTVAEAQTSGAFLQTGHRHLLIMVGLPGDGDYRSRMSEAVKQIVSAAPVKLDIAAERTQVFLGDDDMVEEMRSELPKSNVCTATNLRDYFAAQSQKWSADDSLWLVMIGHTQLMENRCYFNVQGRDFTADDLASWMKPVPCRQQVNFLTMPASGQWLATMKAAGRVNIAATDIAGELTGTEFPYALANLLSGKQSHQAFEDLDNDGRLSLLDLYLAATLEVHESYKAITRLPTEHAQLDDNGDGKAKEIQEPLIPIEMDEEDSDEADAEEAKKPAIRPAIVITSNSDGALARTISLK